MTHWTDTLTWLNPPSATLRNGSSLEVTTAEQTDFWRETFYGYITDNGHALLGPTQGDFTAELSFSGQYEALYDQAGLMLRADAGHWIKAGVEMTDGQAHFSVVVTNGKSDWSQLAMGSAPDPLAMRVTRHGDAIRVQYRDAGGGWVPVRLAYFPPELPLHVGPMCCSPRRGGFKATFHSFAVGPAISRDLHG
jgi:uncharacterized protein